LSQRKCDILLNRAIDLGINFVDTAEKDSHHPRCEQRGFLTG
jgi:aryl-alcohol dehydrogenase-like predicted oxidoreductase